MKNSVIVLLVVALIVLVIGAVNQDQRVDLDYVFGTWRDVSVFTLTAIVAAATMVVGFAVAAMARLGVVGEKRKLERELEQVYPRLREAEHAAGLPEWHPEPSAAAVPGPTPGEPGAEAPPTAAVEGPAEIPGAPVAGPAVDEAAAGPSPVGEAAETPADPELPADADAPAPSGPPPAVPAGGGAAPQPESPAAAGAAGGSGAPGDSSAAAADDEGREEPPASSAG